MRVLIIKLSSLGDIVHTLPALSDARQALPDTRFDWVVEEEFAAIPSWHPAVDTVFPIALRRWRWHPLQALQQGEWRHFRQTLRQQRYDLVLDTQGLLKSAWVTRFARGPKAGLDRNSAREPLASLAYQRRISVTKGQHAITRVRQLFARALGYPEPRGEERFGLERNRLPANPLNLTQPYLVFLHGTTWPSKHWPESYWRALAQRLVKDGWRIVLPWHGNDEHQRAERIADGSPQITPLTQPLALAELAALLADASGVVGVDTGLAHLAASFEVSSVTLYGPTTPQLTGVRGNRQRNLAATFACAPCLKRHCHYRGSSRVTPACFERLPPEQVYPVLKALFSNR